MNVSTLYKLHFRTVGFLNLITVKIYIEGFGGNAFRQEVKNKSKWYVTDFRDLLSEFN